jgi:hypothetical protein
MTIIGNQRVIRAPRGRKLNAKSWATEGPLRLLMNNLDPDVAERPDELIVYGGIGKAARSWDAYDRIVSVLKTLDDDQTLLVQSGKPVGVFPTHPGAPRVIIANANLVPNWSTWDHFNELDRKGLMMYGQMTAGSWIYIGSQGIVQGTYETFSEIGRRHFGGSLVGRWFLTGGLGGMGGAQPLAATMAGASILVVECQPSRIEFRKRTGFLERSSASLDEALTMIEMAKRSGRPVSVGLIGNAAEVYREIVDRGIVPTSSPTRLPRTTRSTAICRSAGASKNGSSAAPAIPRALPRPPSAQWQSRYARSSHFAPRAPSPSTTATTSERWPRRWEWRTLSPIRASSRPMCGRCSVSARDHSAGWRFQVIRTTSIGPMPRCASSFPTIRP